MDDVPAWLVRLEQEHKVLTDNLQKLRDFIDNSCDFMKMDEDTRMLLRQQYLVMEQYKTILEMRKSHYFQMVNLPDDY